jgi:hypothetical protein
MNMFITRRQVSAPNLGHHQAIIKQESEYTETEIIKQEISRCTSKYIKNMYI